jgi:hypothetical protein
MTYWRNAPMPASCKLLVNGKIATVGSASNQSA